MEGEILSHEAPVQEPKKSKTWLIILIVAVVLILCCCLVPLVLWFTGDGLMSYLDFDPTTLMQ